jgi:hypothetical protein
VGQSESLPIKIPTSGFELLMQGKLSDETSQLASRFQLKMREEKLKNL